MTLPPLVLHPHTSPLADFLSSSAPLLYSFSPVLSLQHIYSFSHLLQSLKIAFIITAVKTHTFPPTAFPSFPHVPSSSPAVWKHSPPLLRAAHTAFKHFTQAHRHTQTHTRAAPCLPGQCCKPMEQMGSAAEWLSCALTNCLSVQCCSDEGMMSFCTVSCLNLAAYRLANPETGNRLKNLATRGSNTDRPELFAIQLPAISLDIC